MTTIKNFAIIGAAGYVAPRHMRAISETGNRLVVALDPSDSVGILDTYFPDAHFFTEFERFDRHVDKLRRSGEDKKIHYASICSPNYLHDSHIRFALRSEANAICEKPLVLNPWNVDALSQVERESGFQVTTILQLRHHPSIQALRDRVASAPKDRKYEVDLTYITSRGRWYLQSWKADQKKSGGVATNIGVHFFDMLHFIFGELQENRVHLRDETRASGFLEYEHARVRWFLSIDASDLPARVQHNGQRTYRSITVDGEELEFTEGFVDLHTLAYEKILQGSGFGLEDSRPAIEAVANIRQSQIDQSAADAHPFIRGKGQSRA